MACYAADMAAYIPPDWPTGVHPPGTEDFETTAVAWLLGVVPPDFRLHGVLRRHPAALAAMARHHTQACVEGARAGYRTTRTELGEAIPPHAVDAVLAAYRDSTALARFAWVPYLSNPKLERRLHRVSAPALVVAPSEDRLIPVAHARRYAELIPGARFAQVPDSGHAMYFERPAEFAAVVTSFLHSCLSGADQ